MAQLQPMSQESERVGSGATLSVTAWVVVFGLSLCLVAGFVLAARTRSIAPAQAAPAPRRPALEVGNVRSALFRRPAAGELLPARQREKLASYGWVDRERGIVRIPIDVAIELESGGARP